MEVRRLLLLAAGLILTGRVSLASEAPPMLQITNLSVFRTQTLIEWAPYPHVDDYQVLVAPSVDGPWTTNPPGQFSGFRWRTRPSEPQQFYRLLAQPLSDEDLLAAQVVNRLAYGPTPDELDRIRAMGADAYIDEQLAPETIPENFDVMPAVATNAAATAPGPQWIRVVATGRATGSSRSNLYIYMTAVGQVHVDDIRLVRGADPDAGPNLVVNGDFEAPLASTWQLSPNVAGSRITSTQAHSGRGSLLLVSTAPGSGQNSSIWQTMAPVLTNGETVTLSYWFLPTSHSHHLTIRLGGSGTVSSGRDAAPPPTWYYVTQTGPATGSRNLYVYLSGAGEVYLDDMKLVAGTVPEVGPNLLANGDFESPLEGTWELTEDFTNSAISTALALSGRSSLHLVATAAGRGYNDAVFQTIANGLTNGQPYTLSYWYIPDPGGRTLTVRFGSSGRVTPNYLNSQPDRTAGGLRRRLDTRQAQLADLRAWFVQSAVRSRRQLLQVLLQFLENHFVTEHTKSRTYLGKYYRDGRLRDILAADWEYREITHWREALLRPDCTFYDLLKISAESPAMIVYLDTVDSRGDGRRIANENYARELFELFCMGVDNGYDQNDIVAMSRAWTGWYVDILDVDEADNPHAPRSTTYGFYPGNGSTAVSNRVGVWSFRFRPERHGTNRAPILSVWSPDSTPDRLIALGPKRVPARFGPPWAGQPYQLVIPRRTGHEAIEDGYDVIRHLANLPFTMEYISIKLCRLFVHDDFPNPTVDPSRPEYAFYDYTRSDLSPEARLVHACMMAWWNSNPKGQIRPVLRTIFQSELFRTRAGVSQKIKTPLELAVSAVRALRAAREDGTWTADTDGYSIAGASRTTGRAPLIRMGQMKLFDRSSPDGYPEAGPPWVSAGALAERIRFLESLMMAESDPARSDDISGGNHNLTDPVGLLKLKRPPEEWRDPTAVAAFFVQLLYPAEGRANLSLYHQAAVRFLNLADDGRSLSLFSTLDPNSALYDTRVRGMVAMLMSFPRFQEQ